MQGSTNHADAVILTILPEEYTAVVDALGGNDIVTRVAGDNHFGWRSCSVQSNNGPIRVVVGNTATAGNDKMQAAAADGLALFQPSMLFVVGVGGGVPKDKDPMSPGDVVVADAIWNVDRGAIGANGLSARAISQITGWNLLPGLQSVYLDAPNWSHGLTNADGTAPRVITGGIAATNYLLKVQEHEIFQAIVDVSGNTVRAVEMESWGANVSTVSYGASSRKAVQLGIIRGLSDVVRQKAHPQGDAADSGEANSHERNSWKARAATVAARLACKWLTHAWPYKVERKLGSLIVKPSHATIPSPEVESGTVAANSEIQVTEPSSVALSGEPQFDYDRRNGPFNSVPNDSAPDAKESAAGGSHTAHKSQVCTATQHDLVKRLRLVESTPFFVTLLAELAEEELGGDYARAWNVEALVNWLFGVTDEYRVQQVLYAIRDAMGACRQMGSRKDALEAAAALYYMCFRSLVRKEADGTPAHDLLLRFPKIADASYPNIQDAGQIIAAFVAASYFGGVLEFEGSGIHRSPQFTKAMSVATDADKTEFQMDRALFRALLPTHPRTPCVVGESGELSLGDKGLLVSAVKNLRRRGKEKVVALVIRDGELYIDAGKRTVSTYSVPVFLEHSVAMETLFGMDTALLIAELQECWRLDQDLRGAPSSSNLQTEETPMPTHSSPSAPTFPPNVTVHIQTGNASPVAVTTGSGSPVSQSSQANQSRVDLQSLQPLLDVLSKAISVLPVPQAKDDCTAKLVDVNAEVRKPVPDASRIKTLLGAIKDAPKYLEGGQAVAEAVNAITHALSPILDKLIAL